MASALPLPWLWLLAALLIGREWRGSLLFDKPALGVATLAFIIVAGVFGYWSSRIHREELARIDAQRQAIDELQRRLLDASRRAS